MGKISRALSGLKSSGDRAEFFVLLVPVMLVVYSTLALNVGVDYLGQLDHIVYVLAFMFVYYLLSMVGSRPLRIFGLFVFLAVNVFLVWGNLIYFRFFNVLAPVGVLSEYRNTHFAAAASPLLIKWPDLLFMVVGPALLMFWPVKKNSAKRANMGKAARLLPVIILAVLVHWSMGDDFVFAASQVNPVVNMPRQLVQKQLRKRMLSDASDMLGAMKPDGLLYESCDDEQYPLLKRPLEGFRPFYDWKGIRPNIVLVVVESLQASEMGAYSGGRRSYTPNLDGIAGKGVVFSNYYSSSVNSFAGESAMLLSQYPVDAHKGLRGVNTRGLPMIMKDIGYGTISFSGFREPWLSDYRKTLGIDRTYDTVPAEYVKVGRVGFGPSDEDMLGYSMEVMSGMKEPFFAAIYTLSSHTSFLKKLPSHVNPPPADGDERYKEYSSGYYYADYAIGNFMKEALKRPFFENTVFVFTADHGAYVAEDGLLQDKLRMAEVTRRLPLVIYAPGWLEPGVVDTPGSQVDLMPTILDLLGVYEENAFAGSSLLRGMDGPRMVFMPSFSREQANIRVGDRYCHYISSSRQYKLPKGLVMTGGHVCFQVPGDMLLAGGLDKLSPLSEGESRGLLSSLWNLHDLNAHLQRGNMLWPEGGTSKRCQN